MSDAVIQAQATHDDAKTCFDAFQTCIDAAADDTAVAACQQALASCLPTDTGVGPASGAMPDLCNPPPDGDRRGDHDCMMGDGGMMPPPPGPGPGGLPPPPPPDGGLPPPPPGGPGPGGHHGPGVPLSPAGHIALATCHAELNKCLAAGGDTTTCMDTAHQCVHDALVADFNALCAAVQTQCAQCADSKACVDLTAKCAAGVPFPDGPPPSPSPSPTVNAQ